MALGCSPVPPYSSGSWPIWVHPRSREGPPRPRPAEGEERQVLGRARRVVAPWPRTQAPALSLCPGSSGTCGGGVWGVRRQGLVSPQLVSLSAPALDMGIRPRPPDSDVETGLLQLKPPALPCLCGGEADVSPGCSLDCGSHMPGPTCSAGSGDAGPARSTTWLSCALGA